MLQQKSFFAKTPAEHPKSPADYYRQTYFEALDLVISTIKDRFDQEDYKMYANL